MSYRKIFSLLFFSGLILFFHSACQFKQQFHYGVIVDSTEAVPVSKVVNETPSQDITVKGKITSVCQGEGCWLRLDAGNGVQLFVDWDKKFAVPRNIEGKTVFVHGYSYIDTTSVDELRQNGRDNGWSQDSIHNLSKPKLTMSFKADGIEIQ